MASFTPDFQKYTDYTSQYPFNSVVFPANAPLRGQDLNELQEIQKERLNRAMGAVVPDCYVQDWKTTPDMIVMSSSSGNLQLTMTLNGWAFFHGIAYQVVYEGTWTGLEEDAVVSLSLASDVADENTVIEAADGSELENYLLDDGFGVCLSRRNLDKVAVTVSKEVPVGAIVIWEGRSPSKNCLTDMPCLAENHEPVDTRADSSMTRIVGGEIEICKSVYCNGKYYATAVVPLQYDATSSETMDSGILYCSEDSIHWEECWCLHDVEPDSTYGIEELFTDNGYLIAGSRQTGKGYFSSDGGETWACMDSGTSLGYMCKRGSQSAGSYINTAVPHVYNPINILSVDGAGATTNHKVLFVITYVKNGYRTLTSVHVYISKDSGATWGVYANTEYLWDSTSGVDTIDSVFYDPDRGLTFRALSAGRWQYCWLRCSLDGVITKDDSILIRSYDVLVVKLKLPGKNTAEHVLIADEVHINNRNSYRMYTESGTHLYASLTAVGHGFEHMMLCDIDAAGSLALFDYGYSYSGSSPRRYYCHYITIENLQAAIDSGTIYDGAQVPIRSLFKQIAGPGTPILNCCFGFAYLDRSPVDPYTGHRLLVGGPDSFDSLMLYDLATGSYIQPKISGVLGSGVYRWMKYDSDGDYWLGYSIQSALGLAARDAGCKLVPLSDGSAILSRTAFNFSYTCIACTECTLPAYILQEAESWELINPSESGYQYPTLIGTREDGQKVILHII